MPENKTSESELTIWVIALQICLSILLAFWSGLLPDIFIAQSWANEADMIFFRIVIAVHLAWLAICALAVFSRRDALEIVAVLPGFFVVLSNLAMVGISRI